MNINKSIDKANELIACMTKENFVFRFASIDSYAFIKERDVRVNENLSLDAKIFMVFHEYNHLKTNKFIPSAKTIFNFSEVVEKEDIETIKDLKKLDFDFNKLKGLFFFDKIFKDPEAKALIDASK